MFLFGLLFFFFEDMAGLSGQNINDVTCYFESDKGEAYNGTVNTTFDGKSCMNWKTYNSTYTPYYPDHNYCRNPRLGTAKQFQFEKPWCYTGRTYNYGLCNIPACECLPNRFGKNCEGVCHCQHGECENITGVCYNPGCRKGWTGHSCNYTTDCVLKIGDTTYNGTVNITKNNLPCRRWLNSDIPLYHVLEENFCRNPPFDTLDYPWCYTESGKPRFDICAIPLCVCQPGYFGKNCHNKCHCAIDGCNTITGECYNQTAGCKVPWTGRSCSIRFSCPDLQIISTIHLLTPTSFTGYHINDTVVFLCERGYTLSGPDTLICIINDSHTGGKWDNSQPVCQYIECSKSSLHLSDNEIINTRSEIFNYGDTVNISCKQGYIGESKITKCFEMNKWSDNRPVCRGFSCPVLQQNSTSHFVTPTILTGYHINDTVKFSCDVGYALSGPVTLLCIINESHTRGKWNTSQPVCEKKSGSHTIPVERDGIYMSYGSFGGVLTTIVVISAGVYLGACFYHRRRVKKHISIYEDLQFKSVQRQTVINDDTYVELQ